MNPSMNGPAPAEDQAKLLEEALNVVKVQAHHMKKCLDNNKLMDGLKHCSTMLAELRTSALTPKNYYELYMAIFDALRHLTIYLIEAHTAGRHHLADLYELVQYAGNIVPRLYLMITVGAAYMSIKDAPVREIMRDMMEMSRGVQHPTRGLFLRHYLSGMTRDYLPVGDGEGPEGNLSESIKFILTNFTEMNKLWVRLQHQGHSRDREKREAERRELKILVGTNLVRLSQLEGVDLEIYKTTIMPGVLDQVVSCRDVIAQEYLMEVIIQVFPDEYHLRSLEPFLTATAQLHPKLNVKSIIIALIDRLAAFAAREAESETEDQTKAKLLAITAEEKEKRKAQAQDKAETNEDAEPAANEEEKQGDEEQDNDQPTSNGEEKTADADVDENEDSAVKKYRGIPQDVELFVVFWTQIVELVKQRPDLTVQDLTALLVSLTNLSLSCYPEKINYVNQVLTYAKDKVIEFSDTPDLHSKITESNLLALLLAPITNYPTVLTLLLLDSYQPLLALQTYNTRKSVAQAIISSILRNETIISEPEDVNGVLEMCDVLIRDQKDAPVVTAVQSPVAYGNTRNRKAEFISPEQEELAEEQGWLARIIHLLRSDDEDKQFLLLSAARKQLSEGGERVRYTFPPLTISAIKLARRYKLQENQDENWEKKIAALFRFIHQVIALLESKTESSDTCLRLYLLAGQSADECGFEDVAYEFFVQAFTIYEDSICDSRAQYQAITLIVGTLQTTRVFSYDNYDTLITKAALHGSKLLKKADQCRAVYMSSHLWWATERFNEGEGEEKELFRDGQRVLECLQKALKIADSTLDAVTNVELFVEILNRYIYYFEQRNEAVTVKYLNGLIDLINTNLANMDNPDQHPRSSSSSSLFEIEGPVSEYVSRHFKSTLLHLQNRAEVARAKVAHDSNYEGARYNEVDLGDI
ncbi:vacuolar protein sorting-associated protein 35 [Umbelopsis sp. PMI_123]|nr:vacuolar protein sorting-associated protein 35 [Umbelopsis sp. PMI_123]